MSGQTEPDPDPAVLDAEISALQERLLPVKDELYRAVQSETEKAAALKAQLEALVAHAQEFETKLNDPQTGVKARLDLILDRQREIISRKKVAQSRLDDILLLKEIEIIGDDFERLAASPRLALEASQTLQCMEASIEHARSLPGLAGNALLGQLLRRHKTLLERLRRVLQEAFREFTPASPGVLEAGPKFEKSTSPGVCCEPGVSGSLLDALICEHLIENEVDLLAKRVETSLLQPFLSAITSPQGPRFAQLPDVQVTTAPPPPPPSPVRTPAPARPPALPPLSRCLLVAPRAAVGKQTTVEEGLWGGGYHPGKRCLQPTCAPNVSPPGNIHCLPRTCPHGGGGVLDAFERLLTLLCFVHKYCLGERNSLMSIVGGWVAYCTVRLRLWPRLSEVLANTVLLPALPQQYALMPRNFDMVSRFEKALQTIGFLAPTSPPSPLTNFVSKAAKRRQEMRTESFETTAREQALISIHYRPGEHPPLVECAQALGPLAMVPGLASPGPEGRPGSMLGEVPRCMVTPGVGQLVEILRQLVSEAAASQAQDPPRSVIISVIINIASHHQHCVSSSTLRLIINIASLHQHCVSSSTLRLIINIAAASVFDEAKSLLDTYLALTSNASVEPYAPDNVLSEAVLHNDLLVMSFACATLTLPYQFDLEADDLRGAATSPSSTGSNSPSAQQSTQPQGGSSTIERRMTPRRSGSSGGPAVGCNFSLKEHVTMFKRQAEKFFSGLLAKQNSYVRKNLAPLGRTPPQPPGPSSLAPLVPLLNRLQALLAQWKPVLDASLFRHAFTPLVEETYRAVLEYILRCDD
ncbi:hypothetical protein PAPYR_6281 [Paratrimastix pyriformis]|uniref:Uncharacterized protein n=1 Tax=Paratrimastix pyriformis TaxID=342808 RepID=A0ABQ8UFH6_9EUKA|nr:hypothetical protein PAPYR_6281 [Paratrimastix pyriformis]